MGHPLLTLSVNILFLSDEPEGDPESQKQALDDEKKEREHLLALNQVIARQVMEKSRMVAGINFIVMTPKNFHLSY